MWLSLIKEELGDEWMKPELFRIGASTLLADIERQVRSSSPLSLDAQASVAAAPWTQELWLTGVVAPWCVGSSWTMVIHSSIFAWRIPWVEKPGRLQCTGSHRVRHD